MEQNTPVAEEPSPTAPTQAPVMDVTSPAPSHEAMASPPAEEAAPSQPEQPKAKDAKPASELPKAPRPQKNGVTAAIVATVIIVLGLALIAAYAYMKTK